MKLRTKLIAAFMPLILVSVATMTVVARRGVQTTIEQEVAKRGILAASNVAQDPGVLQGFRSKDENQLLPSLQSILEQTQGLYAIALGPSGRVLAHTNVAEKGKVYRDPVTLSALHSTQPMHQRVEVGSQPVMDVSFPVWDVSHGGSDEAFLLLGDEGSSGRRRLGTLRIGLPLQGAQATADRISGQLFWVIAVGSILAFGLALLYVRRILTPVRLLARATERVGRGDLSQTVPVLSSDEIGELAQSFNRMSRDLAETTVSKDFLDSILKDMLDALIVTTPDGHIRLLNKSALDMAGCSEAELMGRPVGTLLSGKEGVFEGSKLAERIQTEAVWSQEGYVLRCGGERIPVLLGGSAFRNKEGGVEGFILTAKDMTERRQAEEARQQLERKLVQSERMASVGTVAAGIVHNLKNPLTGIMGFAELLKLRNPDLREADRIMSCVQQMSEMVENILSKSRQKQTAEPVDVNGLLERELNFMQADPVFKHETVKKVRLSNKLPPVMCVYTDLSQVFGNLLRNAVDAMYDRPEKRLSVFTSQEGQNVVVEVKDTGCGIPEQNMSRLFDPFFTTKVENAEKGRPKGTGLGLYMVSQLLEGYRAKVEVESTVDVGTTFRVKIPLSQQGLPEKP